MIGTIIKRVLRGTSWNLIAVLFNQGSTLLANVAVARTLNTTDYGAYSIVVNTLLVMATLAQVSTGYTAAKYTSEYRITEKARANSILGACSTFAGATTLLGVMALLTLAPYLADNALHRPDLSATLSFGAAYLGFTAYNGFQMGALSGLEHFRGLAFSGVISGLTVVCLVPLGALLGGLNGAIVGLSLAAIVRCLVHGLFLRAELRRQNLAFDYRNGLRQERSILYRFALPAAIAGYVSLPALWISNTFLVQQPNGYVSMALFAAANNLRVVVLFLPLTANVVGMAVLNSLLGQGKNLVQKAFATNVVMMTALGLLSAILVGLLAPILLSAFGSEYVAAVSVGYLLLIAAVLETLATALYQRVQSTGKLWLSLALITIPRELTFLGFAALLVPLKHAEGLAMSYGFGWTVCVATTLLAVKLALPPSSTGNSNENSTLNSNVGTRRR